jgi:hypothetical protein
VVEESEEYMLVKLTETQQTALKTLSINRSSTKSSPAMRALANKGLVKEISLSYGRRIYRLSELGEATIQSWNTGTHLGYAIVRL